MITGPLLEELMVRPGKKAKLHKRETGGAFTDEFKQLGHDELKNSAQKLLDENRAELADAQEILYASDSHAILIVLQALDTAGKDGTIKHVMSGVNPQGCRVYSFKQPSTEERDHNFLWRYSQRVPPRGTIGIFNRSYYEEVLVVRVHPEFLGPGRPESPKKLKKLWESRYRDINNFEEHLTKTGTTVLKFFLHMSKAEQKSRLLARLDDPEKHWKFDVGDLAERALWNEYMEAFEDALTETSTEHAPWYVVPADHKWVARTVVAEVVSRAVESLGLKYPEVSPEQAAALGDARRRLESE